MMESISQSGVVLETLARLRRLRREAERAAARVRFALRRGRRQTPLTDEQIRRFHRDGYLLASGLIPLTLVSQAVTGMWESLGADPRDPKTWDGIGPHPHVFRDPRLLATYTDAMMAAAAQLAGDDVARLA